MDLHASVQLQRNLHQLIDLHFIAKEAKGNQEEENARRNSER